VNFRYGTGSAGMFDWLHNYRTMEWQVESLEGSFQLEGEGGLRMRVDATYGIPQVIWMGSGEDQREALKLLSMQVDGEVDIPELPETSADVTPEMGRLYPDVADLLHVSRHEKAPSVSFRP
jgi:hypothetical protein